MDQKELDQFKCDGLLPSERIRNAAPALLEALENYIIANRELDIAECQKPSEIRQKRSNLQMAEQSAIAAIAAARGTV